MATEFIPPTAKYGVIGHFAAIVALAYEVEGMGGGWPETQVSPFTVFLLHRKADAPPDLPGPWALAMTVPGGKDSGTMVAWDEEQGARACFEQAVALLHPRPKDPMASAINHLFTDHMEKTAAEVERCVSDTRAAVLFHAPDDGPPLDPACRHRWGVAVLDWPETRMRPIAYSFHVDDEPKARGQYALMAAHVQPGTPFPADILDQLQDDQYPPNVH